MARLEFDISGNVSGLSGAAGQAKGILAGLQKAADALTIKLFSAETKADLNAIGGALQIVTGRIKEYTDEAIKGSQAFKDQQTTAALNKLNTTLTVLAGNAQLFGASLQNNQQQIKAYQSAINALLTNGVDPLDKKIQALKTNIDQLTAASAKFRPAATDPFAKFQSTGSLLQDAESKVRRLQQALKSAFDERSIAQYNVRLKEAQSEFSRLNGLATQNNGLIAQAEKKVFDLANALRSATTKTGISQLGKELEKAQGQLAALNSLTGRSATSFNQFGSAINYIIQDAPYAAYNFGSIGNNITQATAALPGYINQLKAAIVAQGGVATTGALMRAGLVGLTTGFGGILLAISLATSAFTIYQQIQQKNARAAEEAANALQKQKQALDNYIDGLDAVSRSSAKAADSYSDEIVKLDQLYKSLLQNADARYNNVKALDELQKSWPQEFGNLQKGEGFVNQLTAAYEKLRKNIELTGFAAAASSLAAEANKKLVQNTVALADAQRRVNEAQLEYSRVSKDAAEQAGAAVIASDISGGVVDNITKAANALKLAKDDVATFRIEAFKARQEVDKFNKAALDAQGKLTQPVNSGLVYDLQKEIDLLQAQQPFIKDKAKLEENVNAIKAKQAQLDELLGRNSRQQAVQLEKGISLAQQLQNIFDKANKSASESGLDGYALEIQKINNFYKELNDQLDDFNAKVKVQQAVFQKTGGKSGLSPANASSLLGQSDKGRAGFDAQQQKENNDARLKEVERVAGEIQRINDEFGVKSEQSRAKELASIEKLYNAEVLKANGNQLLITAANEGRVAAITALNDKYQKEWQDLQDKVVQINDLALATISGKEESETQKIRNEWNKRKKAAQDYYDQILLITKTGNAYVDFINAAIISGKKQTVANNADNASEAEVTRKILEPFTNGLSRAVRQFGQEFISTITDVTTYAKGSFQSIFSGLVSNLSSALNKVFFDVVLNGLSKALSSAITNGTSGLIGKNGKITGLGAGVAAAGIAGGVISAATPQTSTIGQAAGGALSGAAAGAAIGSVIPVIGTIGGAIAGGLIGAIGGIFGSSAARKRQEELQKQQLEEQKKQTDLQRQQLQAYTSQIIGRMTANGVVTNIQVGATGQLVAVVSGRDLQFVLDANSKIR